MQRIDEQNTQNLDDLLIDESLTPSKSINAQSIGISQDEDRLKNPDVVFIGAGPVGLFAAIQLKLRNPALKILLLEKYTEFKRRHPLLIDHSSFENAFEQPDFVSFINALPSKIRTNELQAKLLAYAKQLGIVIEYSAVDDCYALQKRYPSAKAFAGTDGSHSIVHKQIFGGSYQYKVNMRYICEVKYDVKGKTWPLNFLTQAAPVHAYTNHLVSEFVGKERDGTTPVSIRIFVDEATYNHMKAATFKNPYEINPESAGKYEPKLLNTIQEWLTARAAFTKEVRVEKSEKVTVTNLPVYASDSFVAYVNAISWSIFGDAGIGVPYFRSLNCGLLCASEYAKCLDAYLRNDRSAMAHFRNYMQQRFEIEKRSAEWKDFGVEALETSVATSRAVPIFAMSKLAATQEGRLFKTQSNARDQQYDGESNNKLGGKFNCGIC